MNPEKLQAAAPRHVSCVDLTDRFNPRDISNTNYFATETQLEWQDHLVIAYGGVGDNTIFNDIAVTPSGSLFAVGGTGLQVATNDGRGKAWRVVQHTPFADSLYGVAVFDDTHAFSVGGSNDILRTQDGQTWEQFNRVFNSYTDPQLVALSFGSGGGGMPFAVTFADRNHGIVVGQSDVHLNGTYMFIGTILRTVDGGQNWVPVTGLPSTKATAFTRAVFVDSNDGWVAGSNGVLLQTVDGGGHWSNVSSLDGSAVKSTNFSGLSFNSTKHGCVGGSYRVWCTWDGGMNWERAVMDLPKSMEDSDGIGITRLLFINDSRGWLITKDGLVLHTESGGRQWKLWMNVAEASHGKLSDIQLTGLAIGRGRMWAVGGANFLKAEKDGVSKAFVSVNGNSSLILSWPL